MRDEPQTSTRKDRRAAFGLLFVCLMMVGVGNSMLFAILPPLARDIGVAEIYVGAIYTLSALMYLTMSPVWGGLSDQYGRRPLVVFGLATYSASTLILAAGAWAGQSGLLAPLAAVLAMALARTLFGALGSATGPAAQAYVADRTAPGERTQALAGMTAAFALGGMIGPALAAGFSDRIGMVPFMVMVALLVGACAIAVRRTLPENSPPSARERRPLSPLAQFAFAGDRRVRAFVMYGCASWLVQAASLQAIGFFIMDRLALDTSAGLQLAGVALTAGAAALIFVQLVAIPALKVSPRMLMIIGAALTLAGQVELIFSGGYASIVLGFLLNSLGFGFARSGFTGGASLAVSPEEQGRAAGVTAATAGLGFLIAPLTGLWLYQAVGPTAPFMLNVALSVLAGAIALLHPRVRLAIKPVEPAEPREDEGGVV